MNATGHSSGRWITKRSAALWLGPLAAAAMLLPLPSFASPSWNHSAEAFVLLRGGSAKDSRNFVDVLRAAGGHVAILYPAGAAVVYADDAVLALPSVASQVEFYSRGRVVPGRDAVWNPSNSLATRAWNRSLEMARRNGLVESFHSLPRPSRALADAGSRPVPLDTETRKPQAAARSILPLGAESFDTSEYMAGTVAVGVWLIEAAGSVYDWSQEEKEQTLAGIQSGLGAWVQSGGPAASLTFILDVHEDVAVDAVPIERAIGEDTLWVSQALTPLGWQGSNAFDKCFAYNNSIRHALRTNWCYSIFVVDSDPGVNEGNFAGGGYAFAYYGGPWACMSRYSSWAYSGGPADYAAAVPMHESGHIFMATDEYDGAAQNSGYFNASDDPSPLVRCVMNQNDSSRVCQPTRDQIGWRDLDGNGVIDPVDRDPVLVVHHPGPGSSGDPTPLWEGSASVELVPNLNPNSNYSPPHAITIATITRVECRIDGGAWETASALDGAFDEYTERFAWSPSPQGDGLHVVEARAYTSMGNTTLALARDTLTLVNTVPEAPYLALAGPNPFREGTTLDLSVPRASEVHVAIFDALGRHVRTLLAGRVPAGWHRAPWDARDSEGRKVPSGIYLARLTAEGRAMVRRLTVLR